MTQETWEVAALQRRIRAARGELPADLVLRGARVVNVFTGQVQVAEVAVCDGIIVGVGQGYRAREERDLGRAFLAPGFIDAHLHMESSLLRPAELARLLVLHGTTAVVADPHEIANVMGLEGIRFMLAETEGIPLDVFLTAPSCVPSSALETAGARLEARDLAQLKTFDRVLGLGEVMNFPGVLAGDPALLAKLIIFKEDIIEGHAPLLSGRDLQAYIVAGIGSDHETTGPSEGREKLAQGMYVMIRQGSSARDLAALAPLATAAAWQRLCLVTDDIDAGDLLAEGHLDGVLRQARQLGIDALTAIRLCTLSPAWRFGLKGRGAIAPGYRADLVVLEDLDRFRVRSVYKDGRLVSEAGALVDVPPLAGLGFDHATRTVRLGPLTPERLRIPHRPARARIIEINPGSLLSRTAYAHVPAQDGWVQTDSARDILKLCVLERHHASGRAGLGLVRGFGLRSGALGSTVAHDAHNMVLVGVDDHDMLIAAETLAAMGGGLVVVAEGRPLAQLALPLAGLMSDRPYLEVVAALSHLKKAASSLGCNLAEPFMDLSFVALPVIPEIKLTDKGLVNVTQGQFVPLFMDD